MSEIARRPVELAPLSPELSPEVMAWAAELRAQFNALGMSISLFCRLHPIDKGTVSRYLNGKRVPADRWFLDQIFALRATAGDRVTEEVRAHLLSLQMAALQVAHPHEYRVRKVSDQLEIAVTSWKEAERYVQTLEEDLTQLNRTYQELLIETERLRTAWDEDRRQYQQDILEQTRQLELARNRVHQAEHRVQALEDLLDQLESQNSSDDTFASGIVSDDPKAIAGLLDSFRRAGAEAQIAMLVEQLPDFSLDSKDPLDVVALLDALRRVRAKKQITRLAERIPELSITNMYTMARILDALRRVGAKDQIERLVERLPDIPFSLDKPYEISALVEALRRAGVEERITVLLDNIPELRIKNTYLFRELVEVLYRVDAKTHLAALLMHTPELPLSNFYVVAGLLETLHMVKAKEQIAILAERIPTLPFDHDGNSTAKLFDALRAAQAPSPIIGMAERVANETSLSSSVSLARILFSLNWAGADDQVRSLAHRAALSAPADSRSARLLQVMQDVGADESAKIFAARIAAEKGSNSS